MSIDLAPLVGHRLAWGHKYVHILTIRDGGVVDGHGEDRVVSASTFYEHAICGRIQGGAMRSMMVGGSRAGAERLHAEQLARLTDVYPAFTVPSIRIPCPTCFSVYNTERVKAVLAGTPDGFIGDIPVFVSNALPKDVAELRDADGNLVGLIA